MRYLIEFATNPVIITGLIFAAAAIWLRVEESRPVARTATARV